MLIFLSHTDLGLLAVSGAVSMGFAYLRGEKAVLGFGIRVVNS